MKIAEYIKENDKRKECLKVTYDPIKGIGSPINRFEFVVKGNDKLLLPQFMAEDKLVMKIRESSSLEAYAKKSRTTCETLKMKLSLLRLKYDFEYWCASCVRIQDKQTKKIVPFIMRRPQLRLFHDLMLDIETHKPVRLVLLKARQWGGSTLVQIFMAWIQLFHRKNWHSVIVADVEDQARNIKSMYSRLAKNHPKEVYDMQFSSFEGSTKNKVIDGRDCIVYLASMQRPDSLRSADIMMAHLSEVGLWKTTLGKRPEDVVQAVAGTVPLEDMSMIVIESTAKGVGNFFHRFYLAATRGESGFRALFIAWYEIDMYSINFKDNNERDKFIKSLSELEKSYFQIGATLEAIHWYRTKKRAEGYDDWRMGCEFPTTESEAFQSTGRRAHSPEYTMRMRKDNSPPLYIGDMFADAMFGEKAINKSLEFKPMHGGDLWLWALPDKETNIRDRYVVSMDIGGRTELADYSVISVIDRYNLMDFGIEECIGTCRFHLDQDLAVWKAVQIATYFNNALLVIEANSLNDKGSEGDHTLTILDEIKDYYTNLYARTDVSKIREGQPIRYGFFTSSASKTDLITQMNKRMREGGYIERDARAIDEAESYEIKDNGSYGAVEGGHDDIYMSRAIGLKASLLIDTPKKYEPPTRKNRIRKTTSESSF